MRNLHKQTILIWFKFYHTKNKVFTFQMSNDFLFSSESQKADDPRNNFRKNVINIPKNYLKLFNNNQLIWFVLHLNVVLVTYNGTMKFKQENTIFVGFLESLLERNNVIKNENVIGKGKRFVLITIWKLVYPVSYFFYFIFCFFF